MNYSHKYPELKHICVTFGTPRVGNDNLDKCSTKNVVLQRYVNYFDPVPFTIFPQIQSHSSEHINVNIINHVETGITRFF